MKRPLFRLLAVGLLIAPLGAQAHSLRDTLVAAYNNSNLLDQSRALLRVEDENVAVALSNLRPQLALNSTVNHSDQASNFGGGTLSSTVSLGLDLLVYDSGRTALAVSAAKATVNAFRARLKIQEQAVLLTAAQAYISVARDTRVVSLREGNVRLITRELRAARDRFEVGEVTRTDVAQAEARLAAARGLLAAAQGDLAVSRELYKAAVGEDPHGLTGIGSIPGLPRNVEAAVAVGQRHAPAIAQAQHEITALEFNLARAKAGTGPTINLNANVGHNSRTDNNSSVGLSMTVPIYQGGQLRALTRQALARVHASRANLNQVVLTTRQTVADSWTRLVVARAQVASSDRQIRAAQVAFDGVREEARLGARTTLDVLNAEQALSDSRTQRVTNESNSQVAAYQLLSAMGQLTVEKLNLPVRRYNPDEYYNAVKSAPVPATRQGKKLNRILGRYSK